MLNTLIPIEHITDEETVRRLCKIRPAFQNYEAKIIEIIRSSGAILKGHFQLLSGLHSEYFLRFSKISALSHNVEFLARLLCEEIQKDKIIVDKVLSPDTAGVTLAYAISNLLKVTRIAAKTDHLNRPTKLINHIELEPYDKVLLVNDLSSTFTGLDKMMSLVFERKATVSSIALFACRSLAMHASIPEGINTYIITDIFHNEPIYGHITNDDSIRTLDDCALCKIVPDPKNIIPSWELN